MAKSSRPAKTKNKSTVRNSWATVSGPAEPGASAGGDIVDEKSAGTQDVASAFPFNGPNIGQNPTVGPLDRVRVDSTDRALTTNQGVPVADNQNSLKDRHCKPVRALGAAEQLLRACGIDTALPDGRPAPGLIIASDTSAGRDDFVAAIAKHRHFARETDPPRV